MRFFLILAVLTMAVGGCGEGATYSTEEVVNAFQQHGYALVGRDVSGETVSASDGGLLTPRGGQPFIVIVASDDEADEAWPDYESQQTRDSFDARRANVVVISDSGLRAPQRERVLGALASLPDRGESVVIAGRE